MTPFFPTRWYYVDDSNHLLGPVSLGMLDALFVEGVISLETRVIREKGTDFQPYSSIFTASDLRMPLL